jgi:hypothetical protein
MLKRYRTFIFVALLFIALSVLGYLVHFFIFRDPHHIFIFMVGDLAFLPLEVFLVVIVIERILSWREKRALKQKLNMVIGAFFSEVGNNLLGRLLDSFESCTNICQHLAVNPQWKAADFKKAREYAADLHERPDWHKLDLTALRTFLVSKRPFLLALLENPNLLENEQFTDLLWAVFHLGEELEMRPSMDNLPESDLAHIAVDTQRLYSRLLIEWLSYIEHLKANYPFLFSFVLRTHPFQDNPTPVVT